MGNVLNVFLSVARNSDGTFQNNGTLATKAKDADVVHVSGGETITGTKNFSASPIAPNPTSGNQTANKTCVESAVAGDCLDGQKDHGDVYRDTST